MIKWNNHLSKFYWLRSVAQKCSSNVTPNSLYSFTLSMFLLLHLIFALLELSSWWYCTICHDDVTITFVLLGLKTKFVSFDHTSAVFRSPSILFEHFLIFFILQLQQIVESSAYWIHLLPFIFMPMGLLPRVHFSKFFFSILNLILFAQVEQKAPPFLQNSIFMYSLIFGFVVLEDDQVSQHSGGTAGQILNHAFFLEYSRYLE